ncbi:MAG: TonB-dependent receptor, partial [Myxococcota bacterium]
PFARVTALEAGAVYRREPREEESPWFGEARASAFTTRVSQDLVFDPAAGRNSVLGPSTRSGVLMQGRLRYGAYADVLGSLTYTRSHLQPAGANVLTLFEGPRLPFIPGWIGRLDATGSLPLGLGAQTLTLSAALGVQYVGERPLPLEQVAEPFTLVDVALGARWRFVELGVALRNLFDSRYRSEELNYVSNFRDPELPPSMRATRHFAAGAPRTYLLTLTLHLDPRPRPSSPADSEPRKEAARSLL